MRVYFSLFSLIVLVCCGCEEDFFTKTQDISNNIKHTNGKLSKTQRHFFRKMDSLTSYYCSCSSIRKPEKDFYFYFYISKYPENVKDRKYYRYGYKYHKSPYIMDMHTSKQFITIEKDTLFVAYYVDNMSGIDSALIEKKLWIFGGENKEIIKQPFVYNSCAFFGEMVESYKNNDGLHCFGTIQAKEDFAATSHHSKMIRQICLSPNWGILSFRININGKIYDCFKDD